MSPLYRTSPVGGPSDQPDYLNAVITGRTSLPAHGPPHPSKKIRNLRWHESQADRETRLAPWTSTFSSTGTSGSRRGA